jgi:hypothetical protein
MENATGFRLSIGKLLTLFPPIAIIILYVFAVTHPDLFVFLGGFASDEKNYHLPAIINFANTDLRTGVDEYRNFGSATFPLFHVFFSILYRISAGNILFLRFFNSFLSLLTAYLLYLYVGQRFGYKNKRGALCISTAFAVSPTIFGSSIVLSTDAFPFLFVVLTAFGLQRLKKENGSYNLLSILLISLVSFLAFYARQFYFWMPILSFIAVVRNQLKHRNTFFLALFYALFSLPVLYVLLLWRGLTPPSLQNLHQSIHNPLASIVYPLAIISIYALPLYVFTIIRGSFRRVDLSLYRNKKAREFTFYIFLPSLVFFFLACFNFNFNFTFAPAGMIDKLSTNRNSYFFLISASWIGFLIVGDWVKQNIAVNYFWIFVVGQFIPTSIIYLRYMEPLLWVLIFLFTASPHINRFYNSRFIVYFPFLSLAWWLIKAV